MKGKRHIQSFNEHGENLNISDVMFSFSDYVFENKLTDLFSKFNLKEIKILLKEKLDIDENTTKLEIAKKIIKFYYNLNLKILKYELGAILGSFIFYLLSIVLDVAGVEPFVTVQGQEPGIPHFIMWAAGAILGIYRTDKNSN
jgi:hypothetical protein